MINFFKSIFKKINRKYVYIGKNCKIAKTVKIKSIYGGTITIGNNCEINDGVLILTYGGDIVIGDNCNINPYTIIYGHGNTIIGNNVLIAGHVMIVPNEHVYKYKNKTIIEQGCSTKGINIMDDVWICHGVTITDGVIVGKGAVIGAGSVVTNNIDNYIVAAGIPAKPIKNRDEIL